MIRTIFAISAATLGFSLPAMAEQAATNFDSSKSAAFSAGLSAQANAEQARLQLAHQGYTSISQLNRDENGRWFGTAMKGGKTVTVGVMLPPAPQHTIAN